MDGRDDQVILSGIAMYVVNMFVDGAKNIPLWRTDGAVLTVLLHMGPVEFLYYWFHRALHHHFLYTRYHSHHHSSIATEPITCKEPSHVFSSFPRLVDHLDPLDPKGSNICGPLLKTVAYFSFILLRSTSTLLLSSHNCG